MLTELHPHFSKVASYRGNAMVNTYIEETNDGIIRQVDKLISYKSHVATIYTDINNEKTVTLEPDWDYSQTTLRHLMEFLRQNNLPAESKMQIRKDYL